MSGTAERRLKSLSLQLARLVPHFLRADRPDSADMILLRGLVEEAAVVVNVDIGAREDLGEISDLDLGRKVAALVGDLADASEKIDHLEEFSGIAKKAVRQLLTVIDDNQPALEPSL